MNTPTPHTPSRALDDLSDRAIHFMAYARKFGMSWVHPALLDQGQVARELVEAGVIVLRDTPVYAVSWPWERQGSES